MHAGVLTPWHIPPCWAHHWGGRVGHWVLWGVAGLWVHPWVEGCPGGEGCGRLFAPGYFDALLAKRVAIKGGNGGGSFLVGLCGWVGGKGWLNTT